MKVAIASNVRDGKGLAVDAGIYAEQVRANDHEAHVFDWRDPEPLNHQLGAFDALIVCEVLDARWFAVVKPGRAVAYMVNPEWDLPHKRALLPRVTHVLCRTEDAARCGPWGDKARVTGFESPDLGRGEFLEPVQFLHPTGGSIARGTAAVARAWRLACDHGIPAECELHIVDPPDTDAFRRALDGTPRWRRIPRLLTNALTDLQRKCAVHVIASEYEGWGHMFWEGLSTGAHVIGTDGPWWQQARGAFEAIPATEGTLRAAARLRHVDVEKLAEAMVQSARRKPEVNEAAIERAAAARTDFRSRFAAWLREIG